jgi:hypothetical protein
MTVSQFLQKIAVKTAQFHIVEEFKLIINHQINPSSLLQMNPLSYAEDVRGVDNIPSGSKRPRRVVSEMAELHVVDAHVSSASCLDELLYKHRSGKKRIKFIDLSGTRSTAFYSKATDVVEKEAIVLREVADCG